MITCEIHVMDLDPSGCPQDSSIRPQLWLRSPGTTHYMFDHTHHFLNATPTSICRPHLPVFADHTYQYLQTTPTSICSSSSSRVMMGPSSSCTAQPRCCESSLQSVSSKNISCRRCKSLCLLETFDESLSN